MRKKGLTSATAQHLQRLARGPVVTTPVEKPKERPPVFNRNAGDYQETKDDEPKKKPPLSDKELILTVMGGEGEDSEGLAEIDSYKTGPPEGDNHGDSIAEDVPGEPWNHDWQVK